MVHENAVFIREKAEITVYIFNAKLHFFKLNEYPEIKKKKHNQRFVLSNLLPKLMFFYQ